MTRELAPEIYAFLAATEEATAREIAAGVHARLADVLQTLNQDERFSGPWFRGRAPHGRKVYKLHDSGHAQRERLGTAETRPSQTGRILALLGDRRPHRVPEIHLVVGTCRLNSRIAELRPRLKPHGLTIVCRHIEGVGRGPEAYEYQLVTLEEAEARATSVSSSGAGYPPTGRDPQVAASMTPDDPSPVPLGQLALGVAA